MSHDEFIFIVMQVIVAGISVVIGVEIGINLSAATALDKGFMEYNNLTGDLDWKNINIECLERKK